MVIYTCNSSFRWFIAPNHFFFSANVGFVLLLAKVNEMGNFIVWKSGFLFALICMYVQNTLWDIYDMQLCSLCMFVTKFACEMWLLLTH